MSYYEGLPIYKSALDLIVKLDQVVLDFPKRHRYTLGARLVDTATEVLMWIVRAQPRTSRGQALDRLCLRLAELKLQVQVGKEVKAFKSFAQFAQFAQTIEQVVAVTRQAEGWRAYHRRTETEAGAASGPRLRPEPVSVGRPGAPGRDDTR